MYIKVDCITSRVPTADGKDVFNRRNSTFADTEVEKRSDFQSLIYKSIKGQKRLGRNE